MLLPALWAQEDGTGCLDEQYPVRPSFCCRKRPGMIPPFRSPYHYPVVRCFGLFPWRLNSPSVLMLILASPG